MQKRWKCLWFSFMVVVFLACVGERDVYADTITMTIERFTLGGSFIMEPEIVEFTPGETYETVLRRVLDQKGLKYGYTTSGGFYLSGIYGVGVEDPQIESYVKEILEDYGMELQPNTTGDLFERQYTGGSGWMYYVDNGYVLGMSSVKPKQDDVVRFMYTLAYGTDLTGYQFDQETQDKGKVYYNTADKSDLVRMMGEWTKDRSRWENDTRCKSAYENAVRIMAKINAAQNNVSAAIKMLEQAWKGLEETPGETGTPPETPGETGTPSGSDETVTPSPLPSPSPSPQALGRPVLKSVSSAAYNKLKVTWGRVRGAAGYIIYRSASLTGGYKQVGRVYGEKALSYIDTGLTPGKAYHYKVRAVGKAGISADGGFSEAGKGRPLPARPSVTVTAKKKKILVRWKKTAGADGYTIYRSGSKNGRYQKVGTVKKGAAGSYTDKKVKAKKTYHYKVRAYCMEGGKKVESGYSAVKRAKAR